MGRKRKPRPESGQEASEPSPSLVVIFGSRFKRDLARQAARGKDLGKIQAIIRTLQARTPLEARHRDHSLTGNWRGLRDVHIEPDWILIYERTETELRLMRTGSHSDLGL